MDDAPMNHLLDAADFPGQDLGQAEKSPGPLERLEFMPWRSYMRCFFLTAIVAAVGILAYRPSMLRISMLLSYVSPSRGESLAWKPEWEDTTVPRTTKRMPSPDEWRLTAAHTTGWRANRPDSVSGDAWQGGKFPATAWQRDSYNPWTWQDDVPLASPQKNDPEALPNQKPESNFRAKSTDTWAGAMSAVAQADDIGEMREPDDSIAERRTTPSPEPNSNPEARRAALAPPAATGDIASLLSHVPSLSPSPQTESPELPLAETTASRIPEVAPLVIATTPQETPFSAERGETTIISSNPRSAATPAAQLSIPPLPGTAATTEGGIVSEPLDQTSLSLEGFPSLRPELPLRSANPVQEIHSTQTQPTASVAASATEPAQAVQIRETPPASAPTDWKNSEIISQIPGAYLTIYPKLKFIGLCVPGQGYIRKYNQIAVPMDVVQPKLHASDGHTPFGKYYIARHERGPGGARLLLSWPSPDDARRIGAAPEMIAQIERAWQSQSLPPQDSVAGGGVALSGERGSVEATMGGFALEQPHMEEIATALQDGAWVFIQP